MSEDHAPPSHSPFGRMGPSWTYRAHAFPNGHAVTALVAGAISMLFVSMPGGLLLVPGAVLFVLALWAGVRGRARARQSPRIGGTRAANWGIGFALAGPVLLLLWVALGVW